MYHHPLCLLLFAAMGAHAASIGPANGDSPGSQEETEGDQGFFGRPPYGGYRYRQAAPPAAPFQAGPGGYPATASYGGQAGVSSNFGQSYGYGSGFTGPGSSTPQGITKFMRFQIQIVTSLPYFGVKLSCVCLMFADRKK